MFGINLPSAERLVRLLIGLAVAGLAWAAPAQPYVMLGAIGICVALTGLVGFCPACALAGRRLRG